MSVPSRPIPIDDLHLLTEAPDIGLSRVANSSATHVDWLWPDRIPVGKVTLLVGDPGCGKSLVALDIAARVTRAAPWPVQEGERGRQGEGETASSSSQLPISPSPILPLSPSSVLLLSAEDDLADTIRPRLDAAGADCNRVFILPAVADLRHDFAQLEAAVGRLPDCRLIIVDPINAYVGPNDSHFQTVVRNVLAPLARLAADRRIAVLALAHFRKTSGAAIYRAAGSMGFVSAARSVWTLCRDHAHDGRHFLLPLKTNLTHAACGLAYTIETHASGHPCIQWDPTPVTISAEVALAPPPKPRPEPATERAAARKWLREILATGPRPASDVFEQGKDRGFLPRTLRRAFHEMDGHTAKKGLHRGWWWSLNGQSTPENAHDSQKTAVPFEGVTYETDIAAQRRREELAKYRPSEFEFPPPPEIPPNDFDDARFSAIFADIHRKSLQQSDVLIRSITQHRATPPKLDSS